MWVVLSVLVACAGIAVCHRVLTSVDPSHIEGLVLLVLGDMWLLVTVRALQPRSEIE